MTLLRLPVDRPTTTIMLFIGIFLFGIISFQRLPQELYPSMDYPQITIITKYVGAGPEESEKLISKMIEETVGTVKNIKRVSSISKEGMSIVICEFTWGTDINFAALETREKIDLIKERIPKDAHEPVVLKYNPFQLEAMSLSVSYKVPEEDPWKLAELRKICKKNIKDELERIEGVAKVELYGGTEEEVLVEVDKGRLLANQLSLLDLIRALRETNITYPAGTLREENNEYTVKTIGEFKDIEDIKQMIIPVERRPEYDKYRRYRRKKEEETKTIVYMSDIADIKWAIRDIRGYSRYNRKSHISISIFPQSKANLIKTSQLVREKLSVIKKTKLPHEVDIKIIYDQAEFIKTSLNNIYSSALQGGFLAFVILYIFLKDIVASIIIVIAIPLAILFTITLMYFGNISLNTMSLGGLAIGVGMLVDNSVVVLEKIFIEKEKNPDKDKKELIYYATSHVTGDVISGTLTTIAVFLPLVFVGGAMGQLFKELALTVSYALLSSILVAMFLVPRLALMLNLGKYVNINKNENQRQTNYIQNFRKILNNVLNIPYSETFILLCIYIFFGITAFFLVKKEFMPKIDERKFILNITLPSDTVLEKTNEIVSKIESYINSLKDVEGLLVNIGSSGEEKTTQIETLGQNQARLIGQLKKSGKSTDEIVSMISNFIKKELPSNMETEFITQQGIFGTGSGSGLVLEIKGKDLDKLKDYAEELSHVMKKINEIYGIKITPQEPTPEVKLEIFRDRASLYGLSIQDISATILTGIKGYVPTKLKKEDEEYDIRVRLSEKDRTDLSQIAEFTIYSAMLEQHIRLAQLTDLKLVQSLPEIRRAEGQRMYIVSANVRKNFNKVVKKLKKRIEKIEQKDPDVEIVIAGETLSLQESLSSSVFALVLSIIIIYMILASQFESLLYPIIVMLTIPMGIIGAVYTLFFTFSSINSVSMQGFIMLIGIVVNNGIMLVSEFNFARENFKNKTLIEIVVEVTSERLRPILMTTLTTILGLLPIAIGIGGQNTNSSMSLALVGGLSFGLILTLFFIPISYIVFTKYFYSQKNIKNIDIAK